MANPAGREILRTELHTLGSCQAETGRLRLPGLVSPARSLPRCLLGCPPKATNAAAELQMEERREPLKPKNHEGPCGEKGSGKKRCLEIFGKEPAPEEGEPPLPRERAVLLEELSQAMLRMDMAPEREYALDIFSSLVQKQATYTFRRADLPRSVTMEMRGLLIDWLVQVHEYLNLADETLYLAVYLMNRYMKAARVRIHRLQLLGITCLFLACKLEGNHCPEPAQLCFMTGNSCSRKELVRMERKVLVRLRFELNYANPVHLLHLLAEVGHCTLEAQFLALYFMEVCLMEVDCLGFEPARMSLAALALAQRLLQEARSKGTEARQEGLPKLCVYSEAELSAVFPYMAQAVLRGANSSLHAIFLKYAKPQKLCASVHPAISASRFLSLCLGTPTL